MDKYIEALSLIPNDYLHIASSFALDNNSPNIEPSHLLRALLHKSIGLVDFIENTLDSDYYYLLDWADMRVSQCPKSVYPMREATLSDTSKSVVKEALRLGKTLGLEYIDERTLLFALVSPGFGFSAEQLKTLPLSPDTVLKTLDNADDNQSGPTKKAFTNKPISSKGNTYFENALEDLSDNEVIGFDKEIKSMIETLSRKDRANLIIIGDTGVGKTSLISGFLWA